MTNEQVLAAVKKSITVPVTPARAFELFTSDVEHWWPLGTHSVSAQAAQQAAARCAFEPRLGGEFYEIDAQGQRHVWGRIECWCPGQRLTFTWHPGLAQEQATRVDIRFEALGPEETRVSLVHDGWERRGAGAGAVRDQYQSGWDPVLAHGYRAHVLAAVS